MSKSALTANYNSPDTTHLFTSQLPSESTDTKTQSVQEKTEFLQALRTGISQVQGDVNVFLTKRMEEEKAAAGAPSGTAASAREQKEEEMYGEEDPEGDDA
ncbi:hypothetical protein BDY17DRAFT_50729 [Neohortaea acidophila]|uniref:EKC/KEOPS complex subunit GON7 n=1 Tax=Neohortaea acidophila TaxID=245834 RepID=A0A6A6PGW0_9PEZI|nr:uncharacterized protein BDY17DRAFT_50729 [Neohortaea acidophila]KAF2479155.1 hypothetical protein BDY17DRAFT_50729 [Neohortaea acidophila]